VINSTFTLIEGTYYQSPAIYISDSNSNINISDSVFTEISNSYSSLYAGAVYYNMSTSGNGYYNIKGNTFSKIHTTKSALVLYGSFSSFIFSYNTFSDVSSTNEGGVFHFSFLKKFFIIFFFFFFFKFLL
jgi:hypothetical protein